MANVLALVPIIQPVLGDRPWWLPLGWITVEGGANVDRALASVDRTVAALGGEASLFQLSESERRLVNADLDLLVSDPTYSVSKGMELIERYADKVVSYGIPYGTDFFWGMVKLVHGIGGGGVQAILDDMRANGVEPRSLDDLALYFCNDSSCPEPQKPPVPQNDNDRRVAQEIKRRSGNIHYPSKWIYNAQEVYDEGRKLALLANLTNPSVALPLLLVAGLVLYLLLKD